MQDAQRSVRVRGAQEPVERVARRYGVEPSAVKALQEAAGKSAGRLAAFCERLGYADQEVLLARFQARPARQAGLGQGNAFASSAVRITRRALGRRARAGCRAGGACAARSSFWRPCRAAPLRCAPLPARLRRGGVPRAARAQARVSHGVKQEIVALTEIAHVGPARARQLFQAGLRTPEAVAAADAAAIETVLARDERARDAAGAPARATRRAAALIRKSAREILGARRRELQAEAAAVAAALGSGAAVTPAGGGASPAGGNALSGASVERLSQGLLPLETVARPGPDPG